VPQLAVTAAETAAVAVAIAITVTVVVVVVVAVVNIDTCGLRGTPHLRCNIGSSGVTHRRATALLLGASLRWRTCWR
jgi:hypothetical protein